MIEFLITHYVEITAAAFGLLFLYFEIIENKWMWLFGFMTSFLYIRVFFVEKLYADMSLQVYYLVISVYGWIMWSKTRDLKKNIEEVKIKYLNTKLGLILLIITTILYAVIAFILVKFTDNSLPYWDAFTTSLGIVATWMLAQKIIEQWLVWVIADAVSLGLYIYKGMYPTSLLFIVYTILAIFGYFQWQRYMNTNIQVINKDTNTYKSKD